MKTTSLSATPFTKAKPEKESTPIQAKPKKGELTSKSEAQKKDKSRGPEAVTKQSKARKKDLNMSLEGSEQEFQLEQVSITLFEEGRKKGKTLRPKSFIQMPARRDFGFPEESPILPDKYGDDKLILMPKDPEYMFCYWEITPSLFQSKEQEKMPNSEYREAIKINWEPLSLFEPNFTFIPISFDSRKWYFKVPQSGQQYYVELGWLNEHGHFICILKSNLSDLPENWAATVKRLSVAGGALSYTARQTLILGSSEHLIVEDTRHRLPEWNMNSETFSSSSWSAGRSLNGADAHDATVSVSPSEAAERSMERWTPSPTAQIEIQGKVLPGIRVWVAEQETPVGADGHFKVTIPYQRETLNIELRSRSAENRTFAYDLRDLVLN